MKVKRSLFRRLILTGTPGHIFKYVTFAVSISLLYFQTAFVPVLANGLSISPHTSKVEMLPGTTARVMISIENGLKRSYNFHFAAAQLSSPPEGYAGFPDLSWLSIITGDTFLAPGERTLVTVEIKIPDNEILAGQKIAFGIDITCVGEPLFNDNSIILVSVGQSPAQLPYWAIGGGIFALSAVGAVLLLYRNHSRRNEWTTGLKTRHWLK